MVRWSEGDRLLVAAAEAVGTAAVAVASAAVAAASPPSALAIVEPMLAG